MRLSQPRNELDSLLSFVAWRFSNSNMFFGKLVASMLALILGSGVLHAQGQRAVLSEEDEGQIIESLIKLETKFFDTEFGGLRTFSSVNLSSVLARKIAGLGFSLIEDREIQEKKTDHVIEYLVIRGIDLRNGRVIVKLSAVAEGRPCFAPAFRTERSFTYVFWKEADQWVGRLSKGSAPFPFINRAATMP